MENILTQMIENFFRENTETMSQCAKAVEYSLEEVQRGFGDLTSTYWFPSSFHVAPNPETGTISFIPKDYWLTKWGHHFYEDQTIEIKAREAYFQLFAWKKSELPGPPAPPKPPAVLTALTDSQPILDPAEEGVRATAESLIKTYDSKLKPRFLSRTLSELQRDRRGRDCKSWYGWCGRPGIYYYLKPSGRVHNIGKAERGFRKRTREHLIEIEKGDMRWDVLREDPDKVIVGFIMVSECWKTGWIRPIEELLIKELNPEINDHHNH